MIHVGTSGYSYKDWKGPFYPADLPQREMLDFYAKRFGTVELNFSFYRVPSARTLEGMCSRTPERFLFTLKLHQEMTHDRTLTSLDAYRDALTPLQDAGKLGALLAQFPYSFRNTEANRAWLARLREAFALRYRQEMPFAEIAEALGVDVGLAKWRAYEARRRVVRALKQREEEAA